MRNDVTLAELISDTDLTAAFENVSGSSGDFCEIAEILGLDPAYDFRFSNLNGVDFSGTDLRGYDFRGADLRNCHGIDVLFDDSTNLAGADLQGSCFATYQREKALFESNAIATSMYEVLLSGDPFEISSWIHQRFGSQPERHPILRKADEATAAILCQKLMADDIDLTKRTDLFHFLRSITRSEIELRELILSILARHVNNIPVIEKFVTIAGGLYGNDATIFNALLLLCKASDAKIRLAAFLSVFQRKFILPHISEVKDLFLNDENSEVRKELLLKSAILLGRRHVVSINIHAVLENISLQDVLDVGDLLHEGIAAQIAAIIQRRDQENAKRVEPENQGASKSASEFSRHAVSSVIERQEEVMCSTPIIKLIFASNHPDRARKAMGRVSERAKHNRNAMAMKAAQALRRR